MARYKDLERRQKAQSANDQFEQDIGGLIGRVLKENVSIDEIKLRKQEENERQRLIDAVKARIRQVIPAEDPRLQLFSPEDSGFKDYKAQYDLWGDDIKGRCSWRELKSRLLANDGYYFRLVAKLQGGGTFFGLDDEGNPLFIDKGALYGIDKLQYTMIFLPDEEVRRRRQEQSKEGYWTFYWDRRSVHSTDAAWYQYCHLVRVLKSKGDKDEAVSDKNRLPVPKEITPDLLAQLEEIERLKQKQHSGKGGSISPILAVGKSIKNIRELVDLTGLLPNWGLDRASFGGEFDLKARERMIKGGQLLLPVLYKYMKGKCGVTLEMGPFVNPLVTPNKPAFKKMDIVYLENDPGALESLDKTYGTKARCIPCDLGKLEECEAIRQIQPDYVVVSQVLNYLDYRKFFASILALMKEGSYLFINNVANYGISEIFAPEGQRPSSNLETIGVLKNTGFELVESYFIPPIDPQSLTYPAQREDRLLVVAKKKESENLDEIVIRSPFTSR